MTVTIFSIVALQVPFIVVEEIILQGKLKARQAEHQNKSEIIHPARNNIYCQTGYRDWVQYADEVRFKPALLDYIVLGNFRKLQGNGVHFI